MKLSLCILQLLLASSVFSQSRLQFLATGTLSPLFEPMIESDQLGFHTSSEYEHKSEVLELVNRRPREGEERQFNKTLPFNSGVEINLWFNAEPKKKWIFGLSMMLSNIYKSELINIYSASSMGTQYSLSTRHTYQGVYLGAGVVLSKPLRFSERSILSTTSGFRYHKRIYSEAFISIQKVENYEVKIDDSFESDSEKSDFVSVPINIQYSYRLSPKLSVDAKLGMLLTQFLSFTATPRPEITPDLALGISLAL